MLRSLAEQRQYSELAKQILAQSDLAPLASDLDVYLKELQRAENYGQLFEMAAQFPAMSPLSYQVLYAMARAWANLGDAVRTDLFLRRALKTALDQAPVLSKHGISPNTILQQCLYIDTTSSFSSEVRNPLALHPACPHAKDENFVLVSCNGFYAEKFGFKFFQSLRAIPGSFHIHLYLCDPTPGARELVERVSTEYGLKIQVHIEAPVQNVLKYSCRRFQVLPNLLQHHQGNALVTDIDVSFTESLPDFFKVFPKMASAGLFEFSNTAPMLICHCSMSYFQNTREALDFSAILANYITQKLKQDEKLWTLDQCALFVISRLARQGHLNGILGPRFRWANLTHELAMPLSRYQVDQETILAEKQGLRSSAEPHYGFQKGLEVNFDSDLRPTLQWN